MSNQNQNQNENTRIYLSALDNLPYTLPQGRIGADYRRQASMIDTNSRKDVDNYTLLETVLGLARRQYVLPNACRIENTDTLEFHIDVANAKITANEKVPDLVRSPLRKINYNRLDFDLWKNEVPIAQSDKSARKSHPSIQRDIEDAAAALANSKNSQIATVLEAGTRTSAGGNWLSTDNPYGDIDTAVDSIESTYEAGTADTLAAPRKVWTAFWSNPFVKGEAQGTKFPAGKVFPVPGLPGFTGVMDNSITAGSMIVCDRSQYVILAQGPIESEGWRDSDAGFNAYKIRDWMEVQLAVNNAGYELTAVLSS